jgi:hypothetical protein
MNEMTAIVKFGAANLPAPSGLASALRGMGSGAAAPSGVMFLRMDKTGHWVYGQDSVEVEEGSQWAVNPYSFVHGFVAWGDAAMLGSKMVPISEPLPEMGPAPAGAKQGWQKQIGFDLACISGEDEGTNVRFSGTSMGSIKASGALGLQIADRVDNDPTTPVPVVLLSSDSYMSKKGFGRIYNPIFSVQKWITLDGPEAEPEAPASEEAPTRRRRRV